MDTEDWRDGDVGRIVRVVTEGAEDGAIVLMHDIFATSVEAALRAVDRLLAAGYRLVTVEELFAVRGLTPESGTVYCALPAP